VPVPSEVFTRVVDLLLDHDHGHLTRPSHSDINSGDINSGDSNGSGAAS
jgi:hypothetical protein